jgi:hypothetical protein
MYHTIGTRVGKWNIVFVVMMVEVAFIENVVVVAILAVICVCYCRICHRVE